MGQSMVLRFSYGHLWDTAHTVSAINQCLQIQVSDKLGTYCTPTIKFMAITIYDTVCSPINNSGPFHEDKMPVRLIL